jgi:hypothetical protein
MSEEAVIEGQVSEVREMRGQTEILSSQVRWPYVKSAFDGRIMKVKRKANIMARLLDAIL